MLDTIVIGLGAMGSAALYALSKRGKKVLGIEQFNSPHDKGSSHGESRVIRQAYFEGTFYVPMLLEAYELWDKLSLDEKVALRIETGGLFVGEAESHVLKGSIASAKTHNLKHEVLSGTEIRQRFPALKVPDRVRGLFETKAGILYPELCISTFLSGAQRLGATVKFNQPVTSIEWGSDKVTVHIGSEVVEAERCIVTAGPWMATLCPFLKPHLSVREQTLFWFNTRQNTEQFRPGKLPIYICEMEGAESFYGFPILPGQHDGVKIAFHSVDFSERNLETNSAEAKAELEKMQETIRTFLPDLAPELIKQVRCRYTLTKDEHFILDSHPESERVLIASCCSGHGFKFAVLIGEILARLACGEPAGHDLSHFSLGRVLEKVERRLSGHLE